MKKIITIVGASLFENFGENCKNVSFDESYESIKEHNFEYTQWNNKSNRVENDCNTIRNAIKNTTYSSAELCSILKICAQERETKFEVHLLATDTVVSVLAAELICEWLNDTSNSERPKNLKECLFFRPQDPKEFTEQGKEVYVIKDLRIEEKETFEQGIMNLVGVLDKVIEPSKEEKEEIKQGKRKKQEMILNITSGYKAIIPIVTLLGQIKEIPLKYIFNETDLEKTELIEIGNLPFSFDWASIERYYLFLGEGVEALNNGKREYNQLYEEAKKIGLVHCDGRKYTPTPLGTIFKKIAKENYIGKDSLGFLIEYKVWEYYTFYDLNISTKYNSTRSITIDKQVEQNKKNATKEERGNYRGNEVDILLEEKEKAVVWKQIKDTGKYDYAVPTNFIPIEVKPLLNTDATQFEKWLGRIKEKWSTPIEIQMVLYSFLPKKYLEHFLENQTSFQKKLKQKYFDISQEVFPNTSLRIRCINIDIAFGKGELKGFMQFPLSQEMFVKEFNHKG